MSKSNQNPLVECFATVKREQSEARRRGDAESGIQIYFDLVSEVIGKLIESPKTEITSLVSSLSSSQTAFLRGISTSGAIWSVRNASLEWLVLGLRGLYIEDQTNDPRETITKLAILNHSAKKIGVDFAEIADYAFGSGNIKLPQNIADYLADPVQGIESVGYSESADERGRFTYTKR
jgi:hypothetical protein